MSSLLLSPSWDITLDANNNLAVTTGNYAIAQDVACACRTWLAELWLDRTLGLDFEQIFSGKPTKQLIKQSLASQALLVPGVGSVTIYLTADGESREIGGQIQIASAPDGTVIAVANATTFAGDAPWWVSAIGNIAIAAGG